MLFVGAFPPPESRVVGGIVASCKSLLDSDLKNFADLLLLDSTQISNPPPGLLVRSWIALHRFVKYCRQLRASRPDLVLIFMSSGASAVEKGLMGWVARVAGVPVLLFPRAGRLLDAAIKSRLVGQLSRCVFGSATLLLCQSERWRDFATRCLGYSEARTMLIENWTAGPEFLGIGESRGLHACTSAPLNLVFTGWVEKEKGIFDLLEACAILKRQYAFHLSVVGDGTAKADAERRALQLDLQEGVTFHGWLAPEGVGEVLARSDIFVLPSWSEGLPNAMIEAMAARLPVVVTGVGGIPDVVRDNETGLLVDAKQPTQIAKALAQLIGSAPLRQRLADAAFELARARFSRETAVVAFRSAFEKAVSWPS